MIREERLLKVLRTPHISEKTSVEMEKHNTIVFKVIKDATKSEIKDAIFKLFAVKVNDICTLIVKGKRKRRAQHAGRRSCWKKAYITLQEGQDLDFIKNDRIGQKNKQ